MIYSRGSPRSMKSLIQTILYTLFYFYSAKFCTTRNKSFQNFLRPVLQKTDPCMHVLSKGFLNILLLEKCPNTEFFLVHILLYSEKKTDQKKLLGTFHAIFIKPFFRGRSRTFSEILYISQLVVFIIHHSTKHHCSKFINLFLYFLFFSFSFET